MLSMSSLPPVPPLVVVASLVLMLAGPARATDPPDTAPPLLTNADLGMSREQLASQGVVPGMAPPAEAPKPPATAEPAPAPKASAPAPEHELWRSEDETAPASAAATTPASAAATTPASAAATTPASAAATTECRTRLTYEQCMERSIRHGNAYAESNRVCRAVAGAPAS